MCEHTAHLHLPPGTLAPAAARRGTRRVLTGWNLDDPDWLDQAEIVVTELVTNAIRHGGGCLQLALTAVHGAVTVSVADRSATPPQLRDPDDEGGVGLHIVDAYTTGWGVGNHSAGKWVWATLPPCPTTPARPHQACDERQ